MIKVNFNKIGLVIFIFFFIFAPPIIPKINVIFILFIYSLFQLLRMNKKYLNLVIINSYIKKYSLLMYLGFLYIFLVMSIGLFFEYVGIINYLKTIYRFGMLIPITVTCIIYILMRLKALGLDFYDLIDLIIKAGLIQAIITLLMFTIPEIKSILVNIMFMNTGSTLTQNMWVYERRLFAFSNSVLDSFGYGTGIIAVLPLFMAIKKSINYIYYVPFLILVPLLNSRTGLIIFIIGLLFVLPILFVKIKFSKIIRISILVGFIIFILNFAYSIMKSINPKTFSWVENGLNSILAIFNLNNSTASQVGYTESIDKLFDFTKWYYPDVIGFVFGTGHNIYEATGFNHSDIGYLNDLWLGGIIGIVLLYTPLIYILYTASKSKINSEFKFLFYFLITAFLVTNIKGYMINYNAGMAITLLIAFSSILNKSEKLEAKK